MADGDILSIAINADGWSADVTIEGWAGKQGAITYDYGTAPSSSNFTFAVVSEGYTSGGSLSTISRSSYATHTVRKPFPNEADLDEVDSGSDLVVRIAFSDGIYNDDQDGGAGTSGTDPTVTIVNDWAVDGGDNTAPVTGGTVTNNSTLDYPKVIAQWDFDSLRGGWRRAESDFEVGFRARHGYGIAMVDLSAIGASSSNNQNSQVTTLTAKLAAGSGLYHEAYRFTATLSGYNQGEQIDLRAIAYPLVGDLDSVIDTNDTTAFANRIQGLTTCTLHCDKTGALKVFAIVDPTSGSDPGTASATIGTARADPFQTVGSALNAGATVIYVKSNGSPDILGSAPGTVASNGFYIEVSEDPTDTGVILNRGGTFRTYEADFLCFTNIGISATSGNAWLDGENLDRQLLFDGVVFSGNSTAITTGLGFKSNCFFLNCTNMGEDNFGFLSTNYVAYHFTGCDFTREFTATAFWGAIANHTDADKARFAETTPGNPAPDMDNIMIEHNGLYSLLDNDRVIEFASVGGQRADNLSVIGNIIEIKGGAGSQSAVFLGADGSISELMNILVAHNTVVGARCNLFYNDTGTSAIARNNAFVLANAFQSYNIKADLDSPADGNRIGDWASLNGNNYKNNRWDGTAGFIGDNQGLDSVFVTAANSVFGQMQYVDEQSQDLGGAGNGDYTPATGSPLIGATFLRPLVAFDQFGTPINQEYGAVFIALAGGGTINVKLGLGLGLGL